MKRIKNKLLIFVSSGLFFVAIQAVSMVSRGHQYQDKEPQSLKKYEKY
ncbi:cyclic lactone autoinducer peptide [Candidatus Stoquefichus massiliensis]|nr:cyclic lactone autoinducer peptide [Candidatus Stoquefichus massiliensis]